MLSLSAMHESLERVQEYLDGPKEQHIEKDSWLHCARVVTELGVMSLFPQLPMGTGGMALGDAVPFVGLLAELGSLLYLLNTSLLACDFAARAAKLGNRVHLMENSQDRVYTAALAASAGFLMVQKYLGPQQLFAITVGATAMASVYWIYAVNGRFER